MIITDKFVEDLKNSIAIIQLEYEKLNQEKITLQDVLKKFNLSVTPYYSVVNKKKNVRLYTYKKLLELIVFAQDLDADVKHE